MFSYFKPRKWRNGILSLKNQHLSRYYFLILIEMDWIEGVSW